jgi:hypothetical protein
VVGLSGQMEVDGAASAASVTRTEYRVNEALDVDPATVARSTTIEPDAEFRAWTRTRRSLAMSVDEIAAMVVETVVCVVPVTHPSGLPLLPYVASTVPVEAVRTSM